MDETQYSIIEVDNHLLVECYPSLKLLENEQDALDVLSVCGEHHTNLLLLHAANLSPDFFDLKTGNAGKILLKFTNYRIRAAALIPPEIALRGRFGEMVLETNKGRDFYVTADREKALKWLTRF